VKSGYRALYSGFTGRKNTGPVRHALRVILEPWRTSNTTPSISANPIAATSSGALTWAGGGGGVVSAAATDLGLFYKLWVDSTAESSWGNLAAFRPCGALRSRTRGMGSLFRVRDRDRELGSPFVHVVAMQALCPRMMLPASPASPGVGVREDDGLSVSTEVPLFACFLVCPVYIWSSPINRMLSSFLHGVGLLSPKWKGQGLIFGRKRRARQLEHALPCVHT
jgi:hypothetical protein